MSTSSLNFISSPAPVTVRKEATNGLGIKLICGAISGVIGTLCIYPLDIIKTKLQNQSIGNGNGLGNAAPIKPIVYNGMFDCAKKIYASQGAKGLYNGLGPNLVGIIPEKAIKLAVNDYARQEFGAYLNVHPDRIPLLYGMLSGATAGFFQVIATNPMEVVKIQLQVQSSSAGKSGLEVVKSLGLKGLYKGSLATLARDIPFSIMFFSSLSLLKDAGTKEGEKTPLSVVFASGIVSGAISSASVTPMDVVKTRLQVMPNNKVSQASIYRSIIANEGITALFKGVVPRMLIVSPLFAISMMVYEAQQRVFS